MASTLPSVLEIMQKSWTDFDEVFWRVRHGSSSKWLDFGCSQEYGFDAEFWKNMYVTGIIAANQDLGKCL